MRATAILFKKKYRSFESSGINHTILMSRLFFSSLNYKIQEQSMGIAMVDFTIKNTKKQLLTTSQS